MLNVTYKIHGSVSHLWNMPWTGKEPHESHATESALAGVLLRFFCLLDENTYVLKRLLKPPIDSIGQAHLLDNLSSIGRNLQARAKLGTWCGYSLGKQIKAMIVSTILISLTPYKRRPTIGNKCSRPLIIVEKTFPSYKHTLFQ